MKTKARRFLTDLLRTYGDVPYQFEDRGKHEALAIMSRDRRTKRHVFISCSPSCPYGMKNAARDIEKLLKEMGYEKAKAAHHA